MRVGDFSVEAVAHGSGRMRELDSGHVLARPGQVYRLRLRNHGPLYCVTEIEIDGHCVTAGGLVLAPWSTTQLERPLDEGEHGRFTVVAEGDESVFGPDGGRDNAALGLIEAKFRRELPRRGRAAELPPSLPRSEPADLPIEAGDLGWPGYPSAPPEWPPSYNRFFGVAEASAFREIAEPSAPRVADPRDAIERAAGTGLTGRSDQQFVPIRLGPLEDEATVVRLRLVIGSEAALGEDSPRPLVDRSAPARPAARP